MTHVSLLDMSSEGVTLHLGERSFELKPLRLGGIARAQKAIRDERLNDLLATTRVAMLSDEVRATAISNVVCNTPSLWDMVTKPEGQQRLLYEAMHEADKSITWDYVQNAMPSIAARIIDRLMYVIAGLTLTPGESPDPTTPTPDTTGLNDGTKNSAGSAIPTG